MFNLPIHLARQVNRAFCYVTGKDSVTLAWITAWATIVLSLINTFSMYSYAVVLVVLVVVFCMLWIAYVLFFTIAFATWSKEFDNRESQSDTAVANPFEKSLSWFCVWAFFWVMLFSIPSLIFDFDYQGLFVSLRWICEWLWAGTICANHKGGKSVFAKAKEKIKAMIPQRRPSLAPVGV